MKNTDTCKSIAAGQYVLTRKVEIEGKLRSHRIMCSNPAYGFRLLDEWEGLERALTVDAVSRVIEEKPLRRAKIRKP